MNDELLASVERAVLAWPGVREEPGRFRSTAYMLGRRELGHVHRNGVADLAVPRAVYDELIASGRAQPHQAGVRGVVSVQIDGPDGVAAAVSLFRMNYDRATTAARGGAPPLPRAERGGAADPI